MCWTTLPLALILFPFLLPGAQPGLLLTSYFCSALSYPIHFALVALGQALEPFEPDAVDLYLSAGLKWC